MTTNRRFSSTLQALPELKIETSASPSEPTVGPVETLSDVLAGIGSIPPEALFLGIASDGLPVLLNLHDPHPGPMLVAGDAGSGKTAFLRTIAHSIAQTHDPGNTQFGVITNYPDEWESVTAFPHHAGTFAVGHDNAQDFIQSVTSWAHSNKNTRQYMLLLVDDLESVASLGPQAVRDFRWLLLRGPARRVWPIVTLNAPRYGQVILWLQSFRTRFFGYIGNQRVAEALGGDKASVLTQLEAGTWFALREKENWLRFWLPSC
ncbi:MAG TPA: FtsK/SpoIIIE domain-containing protein [Anaerolineales bacterium]|nr:FtsK/SpoIIIE domain-containing protein [Anaerolineales bacterium]